MNSYTYILQESHFISEIVVPIIRDRLLKGARHNILLAAGEEQKSIRRKKRRYPLLE